MYNESYIDSNFVYQLSRFVLIETFLMNININNQAVFELFVNTISSKLPFLRFIHFNTINISLDCLESNDNINKYLAIVSSQGINNYYIILNKLIRPDDYKSIK